MESGGSIEAGANLDPTAGITIAECVTVISNHQELMAEHDALKSAISLVANPGDAKRVPAAVKDKAKPFLPLATRRPEKAAETLREMELKLEDQQPFLARAHEAMQHHRRRETDKLARKLQPRHARAVTDIAKAIEALSVALTEEAEIRAELTNAAPLPESAYLPDCSHELASIGTISEFGSPAWQWARRMRDLGVLK